MYILAFETSCDDTSIAIFKGDKLLAMDTDSQIKIHNKTGGVVPEVAAREHANNIFGVLENTINQASISLQDIDYIACTMVPGLMPSLLTGITVSTMLSKILKKPLIEINHIQAHIFSNFLERKESDIKFPLACLTVSGGHNEIYYMKNMFDFTRIWWTTDDAAWEAFDKVAKMMWLEYPGWPIISKLAEEYEKQEGTGTQLNRVPVPSLFPRVWLKKDEFDFSFSWLKSAVKREVDKRWKLTTYDKKEISYEFENAVTEVLAYKLVNAAKKLWLKTVMLAGGVSANNKLNKLISKMSKKENLNFISPVKNVYSMDNAAMVWINAYYKIKSNLKTY